MAIKYMTPVNIAQYDAGKIDNIGWEYDTGDIASPGDGDSIIIPDNIKDIIVTLYINAGQGKVQTTTNKVQDVIDDNSVIWVDWDPGLVSSTIQDTAPPVTAIRMVNVSGTTRLMIRAQ